MPAKSLENDLPQVLLEFVTDGTFPVAEDVVSAEFPASAASDSLRSLSATREQVEEEICRLSRETAPDIDGWISQARQLHADIERSRVTAREIVIQHERGQQFRQQVTEATEKVQHLQSEITLNGTLYETVEGIRALERQLASAHEALRDKQNHRAVEILQSLENTLAATELPSNSHILRILSSKCSDLRSAIGVGLKRQWESFAQLDPSAGRMTVAGPVQDVESVLADLADLGLFDDNVDSFQQSFLSSMIQPALAPEAVNGRALVTEGNTLRLQSRPSRLKPPEMLETITVAFKYLCQHLPSTVVDRLRLHLFPMFSSELIEKWIVPAVPTNLASMDIFEQLIGKVSQFVESLKTEGWHGGDYVISWVEQIPRYWVNQRRAQSLDEVRTAIVNCEGKTSTVERVEKERVSKDDSMFVENGADEDWNAAWFSDNEDAAGGTKAEQQNDDEDVSAWGLEDDDDTVETSDNTKDQVTEEDDVDEAWGWGDDEDGDGGSHKSDPPAKQEAERQSAGLNSQREVMLREFYEVTDIPKTMLSIVARQISDAETLANSGAAKTKIATSGPALFAIPTLIIAMFKATAPLFYPQKFKGGQMLLYNDSMFLAEQLQSFSEQHNLNKLKSDIESVERFGRMSYGKEMHSQRTILMDLLDGCQGFTNCAAQPFLSECESAMTATVERLRDVYKEWQPILSRSATLQSVGSLLSTIIDKVIIDIEDLGDISDAQSQRLVGFCNSITKLEDLFLPDAPADPGTPSSAEPVPMTVMYVPNWLKFQYLINVLEGSLADIKYLWKEGGLSLEFSQEEVVDLLKALFADSDHRKRAVAEVRGDS